MRLIFLWTVGVMRWERATPVALFWSITHPMSPQEWRAPSEESWPRPFDKALRVAGHARAPVKKALTLTDARNAAPR